MINESSITAICRVYRLSLGYVPFGTRFKNITSIHGLIAFIWLIIEDLTVSVICRTTIKELFFTTAV
jgi:hypothetical protein